MSAPTRVAFSAISLLGALALLLALPYMMGVNWAGIRHQLALLSLDELTWLTALWLAGLGAYTVVLTASLPGLNHPHAFMLNAVGSAVSNLLPFGGAAGVAATFAMARGWGHGNAAIAVSTLVTGVWNVMARLLLPAVGIVALMVAGGLPGRDMAALAATAATALVGIVVLLALALRSEAAARTVDRGLRRVALRLPSRPRGLLLGADGAMLDVRNRSVDVLRTGWKGLTFGMASYLVLQALLLMACLEAAGASVGVAEVVAVFAINRMLTTAVITPSGAGISETGTAALLLHFGVPAVPAAAATLLYAFYTYAIEVPAGAAAWSAWILRRRQRRRTVPVSGPHRELTLVKK
ncbi:lysylphosphatidylglycerol synthase domain-containing protein [Spirillospora sp. CA-294931]|uniref:lysylphosphatidylglycerol synthase domain-containing protein n=1 Tax=Spirillospora sp. CA-294931 TaxID=3240042 RepID=UPI003D8EB6CE